MPPVIDVHDLTVAFGDATVLNLPHLEIRQGERVFVLGRSGSGKTTLARVIKGRQRPTTGTARVLALDPQSSSAQLRQELQRRVAMIDQQFFLVPRISVIGNVLAGALGRVSPLKSLISWYPANEWEKAEGILGEVELHDLGNRRVETLSGGQCQRVAIARALAQEAEIILADEPISNLDPELAFDALRLLVDCAVRRGVTLIVNIHQPWLAREFASRIIGLVDGQIAFDNTPQAFTEAEADLVYGGGTPSETEGGERHETQPEKAVAVASAGSSLRILRR